MYTFSFENCLLFPFEMPWFHSHKFLKIIMKIHSSTLEWVTFNILTWTFSSPIFVLYEFSNSWTNRSSLSEVEFSFFLLPEMPFALNTLAFFLPVEWERICISEETHINTVWINEEYHLPWRVICVFDIEKRLWPRSFRGWIHRFFFVLCFEMCGRLSIHVISLNFSKELKSLTRMSLSLSLSLHRRLCRYFVPFPSFLLFYLCILLFISEDHSAASLISIL